MKKSKAKKNESEIIKNYPISNLLVGWYFRIWEGSYGHYIAEGSDLYGRIVSSEGSEEEQVLKDTIQSAKEISGI